MSLGCQSFGSVIEALPSERILCVDTWYAVKYLIFKQTIFTISFSVQYLKVELLCVFHLILAKSDLVSISICT